MGKLRVEDEISIPELYKRTSSFIGYLISKWKNIVFFVLAFTVIGVIYVLNQEYRYEATQTLITYTNSNAGNQTASRLASLAGINLPNMQEDGQIVNEYMMPMLLTTYPVAKKIGDTKIRLSSAIEPVSSLEYILNQDDTTLFSTIREWTLGLPGKIFSWILDLFQEKPVDVHSQFEQQTESSGLTYNSQTGIQVDTTKSLDSAEDIESDSFKNHLIVPGFEKNALSKLTSFIEIGVEGNMVTITVELYDPLAAADLVNAATNILMQEVVNFQIKKTQDELEFLEELLAEAETNYQSSLARLSTLQDRMRGVTSSASQVELNVAAGESELERSRYMQLLLRVEEARVKLRQDTPMFAVLNPVQIPVEPVNGNMTGIVVLFAFLGGFLGVLFTTLTGFFYHIKNVEE